MSYAGASLRTIELSARDDRYIAIIEKLRRHLESVALAT